MITLVVDFHSSTTYFQSQKFLALVTTLKYFFQSVRKILSGPCIRVALALNNQRTFHMPLNKETKANTKGLKKRHKTVIHEEVYKQPVLNQRNNAINTNQKLLLKKYFETLTFNVIRERLYTHTYTYTPIYIYIIIIIIMLRCRHGSPWPSPSCSLYRPLLPEGLPGYILYRHRAVLYRF